MTNPVQYTATDPFGHAHVLTAPASWDEVWFCFRAFPMDSDHAGQYFTTRHRTEQAAMKGAAPNKTIGAWPRSHARATKV